jgi:hypothetical protein
MTDLFGQDPFFYHALRALNKRGFFEMKYFNVKLMLLLLYFGISLAGAATFEYSGNTTGGPTWDRPIEGSLFEGQALSTIGNNVPYNARQFEVDTSGDYTFEVISANNFDPYLFLYQDSFNAANPLKFGSVLDANNDRDWDNKLSKFSHSLIAGTQYYLVTTGDQNSDFGAFTNRISGDGSITAAVPEPEEWAMMLVGAALISFQVRRKKSLN